MRRAGVWACGVGAVLTVAAVFGSSLAAIWTHDGRWWGTAGTLVGVAGMLVVGAGLFAAPRRSAPGLLGRPDVVPDGLRETGFRRGGPVGGAE